MGDPIKDFTAQSFARLGSQPGEASPWNKTPADGIALVKEHLEESYDIEVRAVEELDAGVFKVALDDGTCWIARVFSARRPVSAVQADAEVLRFLEEHDFPAERRADPDAVTTLDGRGVLVTEFVEGEHAATDPVSVERLGGLLGRLHTLPLPEGPAGRPAGSWHHLSHAGGPRSSDAEVLGPLLEAARDPNRSPIHLRKHFDSLQQELDEIDDGSDLPQSLIHIDLGGPNVIHTPHGDLVAIDWAGAGVGARITSLAALAATDGDPKLVEAFVNGYRRHVQLEPQELERLAGAIRAHSLVLDCWTMVFAPAYATHVVGGLEAKRQQCAEIAALVREAYGRD